MAVSREVEIILRANNASVKQAVDSISTAARSVTDSVIRDSISDYGDKVGTTAASLISRVLESSNQQFRTKMNETVEKASKGLTDKLKTIAAITASADPGGIRRAAGLGDLQKQMAAFEKLASQEIQDALKIGVQDAFSMSNLRNVGSGLSDTFEKALNGIDPNDLGGFAKSLGGAASKGLGKLREGYKAKQVAAAAVGDEAGAAAMGRMATVMGGLSVAVVGLVAVLALLVAWAKAADDYQAKLNKTLLNGAGVADVLGVSYTTGAQNLLSLTDTMGAARRAAVDTAVAFRMTTDETAQVLQDLNSAGITYKTIVNGARTAAEAQYNFAEAINRTITYSSMLGVSVSELAAYQNTLMKDVNLSLDRTFDVFGAISKASDASGMATKTFFTAISQATSGMALYNVRIDQAIGLVSAFAKSVGETDAGKILGELTGKKGVDERLRMAATAKEAVGLENLQALFRDSANASTDEFQRSFGKDPKTSDAIKKAFENAGQAGLGEGLMSTNAEERRKATAALADLPDELRERIKFGLQNIQGGAASRMFGSTALLAKGSKGDLDTIAGTMNQLDMASKLGLMDQQLKIMEKEGMPAEAALGSATGQKILEAIGLNEEMLEPLLRSRQYLAAAERVRGGTGKPTDTDRLTEAGFLVGDKSVKDQTGKEILSVPDVYRGLGVKMDSDEQTRKDRASAIEKQRMEGTITNALNAWVQGSLFENALAPTGMLGQILKFVSDDEYDPEKMARQREAQEKALVDAQNRVDTAQQNVDVASPEEKAAAEKALAVAKTKQESAKFAAALPATGAPIADFLAKLPGALDTTGQPTGLAGAVDAPAKAYMEAYAKAEAARAAAWSTDRGDAPVNLNDLEQKEEAALKALKTTLDTVGAPVEVREGRMFPAAPTDVDDAFISKDGAMYRGPSADNILMFKDGGPLDPRTGGGGGGVVININGGDQAMVYRTVARAMRASQ